MTASPISDLNPILMSVGAVLTIASKTGEHSLKRFIEDLYFVP